MIVVDLNMILQTKAETLSENNSAHCAIFVLRLFYMNQPIRYILVQYSVFSTEKVPWNLCESENNTQP